MRIHDTTGLVNFPELSQNGYGFIILVWSISVVSRSGVEKTREGSKVPVFVFEKTREGWSILKPSCSGVEKTRKGSKDPVLGVEKTREGSKDPVLGVTLNSNEFVGESGTLTLCLIIWPWLTLLL